MKESLYKAKEELKRADHLVFVSLKYTRTVDIIKNIIERLLNAYNFSIEVLLRYAKEKKEITEISSAPLVRAEQVRKLYSEDSIVKTYMELYALLRKINKAKFLRMREHRRHVTMIASLDEKDVEVDIDIISEYFQKTKEFVEYIEKVTGVVE
jgi:hypothetical protein